MKKYKLKDIVKSNCLSFQIKGKRCINYLDTSSITENNITNIQTLYPETDVIQNRTKRTVNNDTIIYSSVRPNLKHFGIIENPMENMVVSTGFTTLILWTKPSIIRNIFTIIYHNNKIQTIYKVLLKQMYLLIHL